MFHRHNTGRIVYNHLISDFTDYLVDALGRVRRLSLDPSAGTAVDVERFPRRLHAGPLSYGTSDPASGEDCSYSEPWVKSGRFVLVLSPGCGAPGAPAHPLSIRPV